MTSPIATTPTDESPEEIYTKRIKIDRLGDHEFAQLVDDIYAACVIYSHSDRLRSKISEALHEKLRPCADEDLRRAERSGSPIFGEKQKVILLMTDNDRHANTSSQGVSLDPDAVLTAHGLVMDKTSRAYVRLKEGLMNLSVAINRLL